ncbi:MAG: phosphoribosylformylglycinamidine cyclo-ligase [Gemmatimonadetes bacterium]|nr:MAG: phosphoribosylformylglycinamidine cyclo-ligase [Gemmatimonadota bacterium]
MSGPRYAAAGVDLEGAEAARQRIGESVASARTPLSVGRIGAFGGMVRVPPGYRQPVLVLSTDGVGTKVLVARDAGRFDGVGEDLVNHSVNDILVHGARPLAFLDYVAGAGLPVDRVAGLVEGVARGCRAHGMALAGGETAQMPGLYRPGDFDLAGTIVGVGDLLVALASTGLHTNGYSLARSILFDRLGLGLDSRLAEAGTTVADALLAIHRSYAPALAPVVGRVHGLAHITGGGIPGNLVRVLPEGCEATIDGSSWTVPPLFALLQRAGAVSLEEMRDVFNLGVGMIAVVPRDEVAAVESAAAAAGDRSWILGEIRRGERGVRFA